MNSIGNNLVNWDGKVIAGCLGMYSGISNARLCKAYSPLVFLHEWSAVCWNCFFSLDPASAHNASFFWFPSNSDIASMLHSFRSLSREARMKPSKSGRWRPTAWRRPWTTGWRGHGPWAAPPGRTSWPLAVTKGRWWWRCVPSLLFGSFGLPTWISHFGILFDIITIPSPSCSHRGGNSSLSKHFFSEEGAKKWSIIAVFGGTFQ